MIHNPLELQREFEEQKESSVQLGEEAFAYFCEWIGCLYPSRKIKYQDIWFVRNTLIGKRSIVGVGKKGTDLVSKLEESFKRHTDFK